MVIGADSVACVVSMAWHCAGIQLLSQKSA